jgi:hypothetical protein
MLTAILQRSPALADTDRGFRDSTEEVVLRIDETSKTLVAPQAGGFVTENAPDRDELLALVTSGWDAFAAELGHQSMRLCAAQPVAGLDLLAFDEQAGRVVVAQVVGDDSAREVGRALAASAAVASWDAGTLADVHEELEAAMPGDSPGIVFIGASFDTRMLSTLDWLTRRHQIAAACFSVSILRFGSERLLAVRRDFPPSETADPVAEVQKLLGDPLQAVGVATAAPAGHNSTPPPAA